MLGYAVVSTITLVVAFSTIYRMRGAAKVPALFWLSLIVATAMPFFTGWLVNYPEEKVVSEKILSAESDFVRLDVPENHALIVTAIPSDEPLIPSEPQSYKTDYTFEIKGATANNKTWKESCTGAMERKSASKEKVKIKDVKGQKISGNPDSSRTVGLSENFQDRFELKNAGTVKMDLTNYQGKAIKGLRISVVSSLPSGLLLWGLALIFSALGVYYESWKNCDKVAGDLGFLAFYAVFLCAGDNDSGGSLAPLDGMKGMFFAAIPAFFMGYAPVAGLANLAPKFKQK
ncbi:MAG: hypothetical protein VX278_07710 [Myxococcota bacterium]|nr:hypothetical protein [Myxococcota bacterium]